MIKNDKQAVINKTGQKFMIRQFNWVSANIIAIKPNKMIPWQFRLKHKKGPQHPK